MKKEIFWRILFVTVCFVFLSLQVMAVSSIANMKCKEASQFAQKGNFDKAAKLVKEAIQHTTNESDRYPLYGFLGDIYTANMKFKEAALEYKKFFKVKPNMGVARFKYAYAIQHLPGKLEEAYKSYKIALDSKYNNPKILYHLGFCSKELASQLANRNDLTSSQSAQLQEWSDKSRKYFKQYLKIYPSDMSAIGNLADLSFNLNKYSEAVILYEQVLKIKPDHYFVYTRLAHCYIKLKNKAKATQFLNKAEIEFNKLSTSGTRGHIDSAIFSEMRASVSAYRIELLYSEKNQDMQQIKKEAEKLRVLTERGKSQSTTDQLKKWNRLAQKILDPK